MTLIKKVISYPVSIIYYLLFGLTLLLFHPFQWLFLKIGGYRGHQFMVNLMNYCLIKLLHVLGTRISFNNNQSIPKNTPIIFVSNHQSLNDIPGISYYLRKYHPKFVSKKELGKGIPSVSFNLRHGGSVLIDRNNPKQSLSILRDFGNFIEVNNYSAVIFPEGTRSKTGKPKKFSENGLKMLVKYAPSAVVVPISINNSWKFEKNGGFPLQLSVHLTFDVHEPIIPKGLKFSELFEKVEQTIINGVVL